MKHVSLMRADEVHYYPLFLDLKKLAYKGHQTFEKEITEVALVFSFTILFLRLKIIVLPRPVMFALQPVNFLPSLLFI